MRLLTIEARRTLGVWLFPVLAVIAGKLAYDLLDISGVALWATSSKVVRDSVFAIGPGAAGAAAWAAGREWRRGLTDLLASTPRPELERRVAAWAAVALWAMLAYLAAGVFVMANAQLGGAWGEPTVWPMLAGLLAVLCYAALGYALGYYLRSRFTAPLVAIGLFAGQMAVGDQLGWWKWLSPGARLETSVWYGVRPYLGLAQPLFLLGLTGIAWGAVAFTSGSRRVGGLLLVGAVTLTAAGVGETFRQGRDGSGLLYRPDSQGELIRTDRHQLLPYTPVCSDEALPVCVHPAYRQLLPEVTALLNRMVEPLLGVPEAPARAEHQPFGDRLPAQPGVLAFELRGRLGFLTAYDVALQLTREWSPARLSYEVGGEAQTALEIWLIERAGFTVDCEGAVGASGPMVYERRLCERARRFAALEPAKQRAWLTQQYANLRAGELRLEDVP